MSNDTKSRTEHFKALTEYLKHITTLSTGSIVLTATFLGDIFSTQRWKPVIVISLVGFMLAVLFATIVYTLGVIFESPASGNQETPTWIAVIGMVSLIIAWPGFVSGVLALGIFTVVNLL